MLGISLLSTYQSSSFNVQQKSITMLFWDYALPFYIWKIPKLCLSWSPSCRGWGWLRMAIDFERLLPLHLTLDDKPTTTKVLDERQEKLKNAPLRLGNIQKCGLHWPIIRLIVNIMRGGVGWEGLVWPFNEHNFFVDNELDIHMASKKYIKNDYNLDLNLLTFLYKSFVSCPRRNGVVIRSKHLRLVYHNTIWKWQIVIISTCVVIFVTFLYPHLVITLLMQWATLCGPRHMMGLCQENLAKIA